MTRSRWTAALAAFAMLAVAWLGMAHEARARHMRCAQHGELIDAPELAPHTAPGSRLVAVEAGSADAHCAIAGAQRHDRSDAVTPPLLAPTAVALVAPVAPAPHVRAVALLYRLAPKTSPPLA